MEAGFHPSVQRKLANIIQFISWHHKKQFILTTHSPSFLAALPQKSRKFVDKKENGTYETINAISVNAAFSRMDSKSYPLVHLFCEDDMAEFILRSMLVEINQTRKSFDRLINIIVSGPINEVKNDYLRHKRNYSQMRMKMGFCCVFDGDYRNDPNYSTYHENPNEFALFLYPYTAPEKFLISSFLTAYPNAQLQAAFQHIDHHSLFDEMVGLGLAADRHAARNLCWDAFKITSEYTTLKTNFDTFIFKTVSHFSRQFD